MTDRPRQTDAVILAAGKGTRMNSDLPKVLHPVAGRPMVQWVLDAARQAGANRRVVVVGYRADDVRDALRDADDVDFVDQTEQLGTGHAVMVARPRFAAALADPAPEGAGEDEVFVLAGDMPLLRGRTLARLLQAHRDAGAAGSLATARLAEPTGYGRIVRDADGAFLRIVEQKDADPEQLAIDEVNVSCYCFQVAPLFEALDKVDRSNAQGEFYLTDVLGIFREAGLTVIAAPIVPEDEAEGINNPEQLHRVDAALRARVDDPDPKGEPVS